MHRGFERALLLRYQKRRSAEGAKVQSSRKNGVIFEEKARRRRKSINIFHELAKELI